MISFSCLSFLDVTFDRAIQKHFYPVAIFIIRFEIIEKKLIGVSFFLLLQKVEVELRYTNI